MKKGKNMSMKICPKCGRGYTEESAISRVDNKTKICSECGMLEGADAAGWSDEEKEELIKLAREAKRKIENIIDSQKE